MKLLSLIDNVEANKPPTSTTALGPNKIPFGLIKKMRPLARKVPRITEGSAPVTRFKVVEEVEGCKNWTSSPALMLKVPQLMIALSESWVMLVVLPDWEIEALP